jgi:excisionase family DNA binding protein
MLSVHKQDSSTTARVLPAADEWTGATDDASDSGSAPLLLSTNQVAVALGCSVRHVRRLIDSGQMPKPIKLGSLLRWRKADIERWVEGGCSQPRKC